MRRGALVVLALALGCREEPSAEAGVGGDRTGCEEPGTHSVKLADHSCACEDGYDWCSDALDEFDCCPIVDDESDSDDAGAEPPTSPCDAELVEQLACVDGPGEGPSDSTVWACNGERWVETPGYSTFACLADGFVFAYGCEPGEPDPKFLCGHGQGSTCDPLGYGGVCKDEDIIDTCVWGRRTVDRCSRLCAELGAFGSGFDGGACVQPEPEQPATCECCSDC